jgi:hypothetical protein
MFFSRPKVKTPTFEERLSSLKELRFATASEGSGKAKVSRDGCAAVVEDLGSGQVSIGKVGVVLGKEIAHLVHGGFQMFLRTPSGKEAPALSSHLKALHAFDEDLREGLGLTSLYNLSLGTICDDHLYDRVEERDEKPQPRPWER